MKFIHAADFHMDSPLEYLSEEKAALRRSEMRTLPARIFQLAVQKKAQFILLSGDLMDSIAPYTETVDAFVDAIEACPLPIYIAPGNHDYVSRHCLYSRYDLPENVHIFQTEEISCMPLEEFGVNIWGAGYTSRSCEPLLKNFKLPKEAKASRNILLMHSEVTSSDSAYAPCTEKQLAESGFDYCALGHIHQASGLKKAGNTYYAWPGCPESRGFDEPGEKGVYLVDLNNDGVSSEFLPVGKRRCQILQVNCGENALASIRDALPEGHENDIFYIMLTGECHTTPDVPYLLSEFSNEAFDITITDLTEPPLDVFAISDKNTLIGRFLRRMKKRLDSAENEQQRALILQATRDGLDVLSGREVHL